MKKLLKRIMALSLCACMMMGAASPASAAENVTPTSSRSTGIILRAPVYIKNIPGRYLNMWLSNINSITNNVNVTTAEDKATDGTQTWIVKNLQNGLYVIEPNSQQSYSININTLSFNSARTVANCDVYLLAPNVDSDCYVDISFRENGGTNVEMNGYKYHYINLPEYTINGADMRMAEINEPLSISSGFIGYNVKWNATTNFNSNQWAFEYAS